MNGKLTLAQSAFLEANSHLVPVEQLPDGDLLCLDRGKWLCSDSDLSLPETARCQYLATQRPGEWATAPLAL